MAISARFRRNIFDRLRDGVNVWAPFYTIHKIMAGHLDMYTFAGNEQALGTAEKMAQWVRSWSDPLSEQQMQRVLLVEYGGMGEVLCNLYGVTGKREYLNLAKRFDKKWFFDPLAAHRDELKGLHVNTHIPQVIAAARLYELTGDKYYWNIADYFWNEVTSRAILLHRRHQQFRNLENRTRRPVNATESAHHGRLLRVQHDETDASLVRLVAASQIHGLLRTDTVQPSHGHDRSGDRHNRLLSSPGERLFQDLR